MCHDPCRSLEDFASVQLKVLAEDVLVDSDIFADYTDEDGIWQTDDKTVWTRYVMNRGMVSVVQDFSRNRG